MMLPPGDRGPKGGRPPVPSVPKAPETAGLRGAPPERTAEAPKQGPLPSIELPRGGGAIRGIGEKFTANPATGSCSFTVPLPISPGRSGFTPEHALSYDSGAGNGVFGWGFDLTLPSISRKTDKGLPRYADAAESDTFIFAGAEDLVPVLGDDGARHGDTRTEDGATFLVQRYRPRVEGLFARIERWTNMSTGMIHWRTISPSNVMSFFGRKAETRIADPQDPQRVFRWLLEEVRDCYGNVRVYEYKPEDAVGVDKSAVEEQHRFTADASFANRYLKRIRYCNREPYRAQGWLLELVLDYGEHDERRPRPTEDRPWPVRPDPTSSHRAGFEIRTYRRCRRVLMFHHFAELGAEPCLVRSITFEYEESPRASFLRAVTQCGHVREEGGKYRTRSYPPVELEYSKPRIDEALRELDHASLENLPQGLAGRGIQFVDLHGEGLAGILIEQTGAWWYKPNRGSGRFGPLELVGERPGIADLTGGRTQLLDLDGDGRNELVQFQRPLSGYHRQREDGRWEPFAPLAGTPNIEWNDPRLRFVDLTGDGRADILVAEGEVFTWYPSHGTEGFGPSERVYTGLDEARGPRLVFSDGTESLYLADMSGDGLVDLVRIRNGEVCYWPNLGYGRFGARVTLAGSPVFDYPDQFTQQRVRLADVDGSGLTDILYLGRDGIRIYFNQSGNRLSESRVLTTLPPVDDTSTISVVDLLGNGTACLVYSSPLPGEAGRPVRYVDLMSGEKPHLLVGMKNNLGAETRVRYSASTKFYLDDLASERPWVTRLPFPVHVVERVETYDHVSRNRFVARYAYHHGYYDGVEREFRGFAFVEQRDTEAFAALQADGLLQPADNDKDPATHVPPVLTRTWFHTGAHFFDTSLGRLLAREYFRPPGQGEAEAAEPLLPDTVLPPGLSAEEERQACRALRGSILRQELYAEDGSPKAGLPYSISERNHTIEVVQRQSGNKYGVYFVHPRETIDYHCERNPDDPRVGHELVLEVDDFGNVRRAATIGYGRRPEKALPGRDGAKQTQLLCTCTENEYTNYIDQANSYRGRMPAQSSTFELTGLSGASCAKLSFEQVDQTVREAVPIAYETAPTGGLQKRLIERMRTLYRKDDLSGPLPRGQVEALGLPFESYKLALTPGLVQQVYGGRVTEAMLAVDGRYVHSEGDDDWWVPTGRVFYSPGEDDDPAAELAHARHHFFLPRRARDPFGETSTLVYEHYDLLPRETSDPLGNLLTAEPDYRMLQPWHVMDPNRNRTAVRFDEIGMVVATAVMGKEGAGEGDTLDDPTTRVKYDLLAWLEREQPVSVHMFAREQHGPQNSRWQEAFSYFDGFGREIQKKLQAAPGPLVKGGPVVNPRWVGSGWTIFNNKGKPVRQYEPLFSATADFEFAMIEGVSSIMCYDPADRVVATLHPNHTYEKVLFDAWQEVNWDVNDTVLLDPEGDPDVGGYIARLAPSEYRPTWHGARQGGALGAQEKAAAAKAAAHAGTPTVAHFDGLGRTFLTLTENGPPGRYATRVELDVVGNPRKVRDARDRAVMRYDYDMLSTRIHQTSMEAGERWMLSDVAGKPIYRWDSRGHVLRMDYDALRRPTEVRLSDGGAGALLVERVAYGEDQPDPEARNLRGKTHQVFDGAGVVTSEAYDFKGNLLRNSRQLAVEYRKTLDWSSDVPLEQQCYVRSATYDALSRPVAMTAPDQSTVRSIYNDANLLERLEGYLRGANAVTTFVRKIDYNAKGQRERIEYGNGIQTSYDYDPLTFRLTHLLSLRSGDELQNLQYTYDPVGNITHIRDSAQPTVFFRNQRVDPSSEYTYDAIYRLIEATGREHLGQATGAARPAPPSHKDAPRVDFLHPSDGNAMGRYVEKYIYDEVGNILEMRHRGTDSANPGWTQVYNYNEPSLLEPVTNSNRLSTTVVGGNSAQYTHDAHGNMLCMPHLPQMQWDYADRLISVMKQVQTAHMPPNNVHFVYDSSGERVRKIYEHGNLIDECIYLGGYEIYRRRSRGAAPDIERQILHVMDEGRRLAFVETKIIDTSAALFTPTTRQRFQMANHLGSSTMEVDETGAIIGYEEYYPFGSTSFRAADMMAEVSLKRYRYAGKERDEESGLYYYGARYYGPWLARWTSADPLGLIDGSNQYLFVHDNPINEIDRAGTDGEPWWRFTEAGFYYQAGNHSLFQPSPGVDTGWAPLNLIANTFVTANNLCTLPFNAVTEVAALPERIAKAAGASQQDIDAMNFALMMTGIGEIAALPGLVRRGTQAVQTIQKAEQTVQVIQKAEVAAQVIPKIEQTAKIVQKVEQTAQTIQKFEQTTQIVQKVEQTAGIMGRLRALASGVWESTAGLRYGQGSAQGNRVLHVLEHATDIPGRAGSHGVFSGGRSSVLGTIDEAYGLARAGGPGVNVVQQGPRTIYTIDMGRSIGFVGGQKGAAMGNPAASHMRLVLEGMNVITAFPVIP